MAMNNLAQSLRELGPVKLAAIGGVALLLLMFFGYLAFSGGSRTALSPLYNQLPQEEAAAVVQYLDTNKIPYQISGNGTQINVNAEQVHQIRLKLAGEGIPSPGSGVGYEVFDHQDALGTSNFVNNINYLRAMEGELARTIATMEPIDKARVHLVIPKRELFSRDKKPPTASVALDMKPGKTLAGKEVQAIRHLVSTAVPGLEPTRITIVDNKGNLLARGGEEEDISAMVSDAEEYRINYQKRLEDKLEIMIDKVVGDGNSDVSVAAEVSFDRVVRKSEKYDPEGQVARSTQNVTESESSRDRDADTNVSVANNLPDPQAGQANVMSERNADKEEETINYEISKVEENQVKQVGTVNRLSVAVLVNSAFSVNEQGEVVEVPRSAEEVDRIQRLVESAIGYNEDRGDSVTVVNMVFPGTKDGFTPEGPLEFIKQDFHNILQTIILGIVAVLAILLVIRPLVNRAIEISHGSPDEEDEDIEALMAPGGGMIAGQLTDQSGGMGGERAPGLLLEEDDDDDMLIDIANVQGKVKSSSIRRISQLIDEHPEEALMVLRLWMGHED